MHVLFPKTAVAKCPLNRYDRTGREEVNADYQYHFSLFIIRDACPHFTFTRCATSRHYCHC
ncbi:hypothetical protein BDA96_09G089200 [Sorghum bicolor]|uniref:Uncharacterized protein n=1 Tax=Sorghum bicolor TaxID=4558 RepID=A0A921U468_SORBI|nr:hypothetical protein BDA96_09G089200 [Sorghum bicolor]